MAQRPRRLPVTAAHRAALTIGSIRYPGIKIHDTRIIR
jgi:hypothetical protein